MLIDERQILKADKKIPNNWLGSMTKEEIRGKILTNPIFKEEYNLMISKRDFGLFAMGLKPHRYWSFNETKKYYGLKGNKTKVAEDIKQLCEDWKEFKKKHVSYSEG